MLNVLDLFSGIGGFSLGLERTGGFKTVAFCEIDPFCRKVLAKHWPDIPCYEDVRTLTGERLRADGISVDVICGGFPCQDISDAGARAGISGERSGLWSEYARIIGELRPSYVIVENVAALLSRGLDQVLGDLASLGFDAEWHCIPASAVGAPHRRDRIWIVANPNSGCLHNSLSYRDNGQAFPSEGFKRFLRGSGSGESALANSANNGTGRREQQLPSCESPRGVANAYSSRQQGQGRPLPRKWGEFAASNLRANRQWKTEPGLDRVADGVSDWSHRLKALGNAVVPQIPELIGNAILASLKQAEAA